MLGTFPEPTVRGRAEELSALQRALEQAESGRLSLVVVEGEAGIGKSRLLTEARRLAGARGLEFCSGSAEAMEQTRPFGVVAAALGCVRDAADPRRAAIAALLSGHDDSDDGAAVTVSNDPGLRFRVVDALCDLVEELALERPLVIGLDDLQWADASSLLTVAALARTAVGLPVALVLCHRPCRGEEWDKLLDAVRRAGARHLVLEQLADAEVRALVEETLAGQAGTRLMAQVRGAAGNPLFVIELLHALVQEGVEQSPGGRVEVAATTLPPSLRLTILRRLSPLLGETLQVLRTASLLGTSFSPAELAAVAGRSVVELAADLEEAIRAGVLTDDAPRLRFRHDLIRDAVYADIPEGLRLALHRDAATRLADLGSPATVVAEQFSRGARGEDAEAARWIVRAARESVATAPATSAELLARAVDLVPAGSDRDQLTVERADDLMLAGRVGDAVELCRAMLARPHDAVADTACRVRLGAALLVNGWPAEGLRELDVALAAPTCTDADRSTGLESVATAHLWLGDFSAAAAAAQQVVPVAQRIDDHRAEAAALATQSVVACMRGEMSEAVRLSDEAVRGADRSPGQVGHTYPVHATRGLLLMELDRAEQARRTLNTGVRLSQELGVLWPLATYQAYLAVERFVAGEWDDAEAELEAGIGFAQETGVTFALKPSYSAQAIIRLHRNDLSGAREALARASAVSDRGTRLFDYRATWAQALLDEAEGDASRALVALSDRWDLCQEAGMAVDYAVVGPDLVRLARAEARRDLAEEVTAAVVEVAATNDVPSITGAALRCRGLLDADADLLRDAADAYASGSRRLELALTCEEAAGLLVRADRAAAVPLLERASGVYEQLGATRGLARVDATLRKAGVRHGQAGRRRRPRWGWESLTPTERRVADLVAEGMTNPQIADRLYVSRRTVQTHVSHIFTKLEIGSRAQLAARVAQEQEIRPGQARETARPRPAHGRAPRRSR